MVALKLKLLLPIYNIKSLACLNCISITLRRRQVRSILQQISWFYSIHDMPFFVIYLLYKLFPNQSSSSFSLRLFRFFFISMQTRATMKVNRKNTGIPMAKPRINERLSTKCQKTRVMISRILYSTIK